MTLREALQFGCEQLASSQLRYPREDALLLLGLVLRWPRIRLVTSSDSELARPQELLFRQLIALRRSHFPIQYMSGQQEFYGRDFRVRPGVLIPRAETEVIVEEALKIAAGLEEETVSVLDVGTGSGCIAVSLACEDPRILVTAIEPSPVALQVAELNCRRHGCRDQVSLICCELRNLPKLGKFQMIVSNPPYLDSGSSGKIDRGVLDHEPPEALFGESGRWSVFLEIFEAAGGLLGAEGSILLELAHGHLGNVMSLGQDHGWATRAVHKDLAGRSRVAVFGREKK